MIEMDLREGYSEPDRDRHGEAAVVGNYLSIQ